MAGEIVRQYILLSLLFLLIASFVSATVVNDTVGTSFLSLGENCVGGTGGWYTANVNATMLYITAFSGFNATYVEVYNNSGLSSLVKNITTISGLNITANYNQTAGVSYYLVAGPKKTSYARPIWNQAYPANKTNINPKGRIDCGSIKTDAYFEQFQSFFSETLSLDTNTTFTFHSVGLYSNAGIYNVSITTPYGNCTTLFGTNACTISTNASIISTSITFNASKTDYWNVTGSILVNSTIDVNMSSAVYNNVSVYSLISDTLISPPFNISVLDGGRNYTVNGSPINVYLIAGTQNFTISKTGWYPLTFTRNITALTNTTTNATGF